MHHFIDRAQRHDVFKCGAVRAEVDYFSLRVLQGDLFDGALVTEHGLTGEHILPEYSFNADLLFNPGFLCMAPFQRIALVNLVEKLLVHVRSSGVVALSRISAILSG